MKLQQQRAARDDASAARQKVATHQALQHRALATALAKNHEKHFSEPTTTGESLHG